MNKLIQRFGNAHTIEWQIDGDWIRYTDHQELLKGLLKSILEKEGVPYIARKGIVSIVDIITEFKKVGIE